MVIYNSMSKILLRITFIIALIIAIALIALVIVRYSPRFLSYVSSASASLFNVFKKQSLDVSVSPQTAISGEKVVLTWSTNSQESVSLTYPCNNEYALSYLGGSATKMPIRCGEAFELGGTTGTATVIPTLASSNAFSDIEVTVAQTRADNKKASGIAVITVTSGSAAVTPSATSTKPSLTTTPSSNQTPTTKKPTAPQLPKEPVTTTPTVSGPANLTLSEPQYVYGLGPAVQFTVTNNGGSNSGLWELRATLPNGDTFNSGILAGIPTGGSTLFTLNLGTIQKGSNTVKVTVDVNNAVTESNENDNVKSATFNSSTENTTTTTSGKADLTVKVLSIGYLKGDTIGIRFEIRNSGGTTAKNWRFEADLPTEDDEEYRSPSQSDLKPGEAMEYTLGFDNAVSNGYATIRVDSDNDVKESNEDNNKLRFRVTN